MRRSFLIFALAAWCAAGAVQAQEPSKDGPTITVIGEGVAQKAPDTAWLSASLQGEGKTSVDALRALVQLRSTVENGLNHLAGANGVTIKGSDLKVVAVRGADCKNDDDYRSTPMLTEGPCAIQGYIAALGVHIDVRPAEKVGDAASLAAQLGARDVNVEGSAIDHPDELKASATAAAIADARAQASQIAQAAGARLGALVRVQDENARYGDAQTLIVTAQRREAVQDVPIVQVDLKPADVSKTVRLVVTFNIDR